jgi:serine/threonine protein kinase
MMLAQHLECEKWVGSGASGDTFIAMTTVPDGQMMGLSWPNDDILSLSNSYWANRGIEEGTEVAVKIQKCQETQMIPNREDNEKECLPDHEDPEFAVLRFMSGAEPGTPGLVRMHAHAYLRFGYEAVVLERGYCDLRKLIFKRAEASNPCGTRELTVLDKFNIAKELVEGLQALHRHNIVHADIKPANIVLIGKELQTATLKLLDFNTACFYDRMATVTGTVAFMAPEILKGWEYDERIDVWSVGVTAFVMLTNLVPDNMADDPRGSDPDSDDAVMFVKEKLTGNFVELERMSPHARSFVQLTLMTENKSRPTARTLIAHMWLHEEA